jgi:hypothetical protein
MGDPADVAFGGSGIGQQTPGPPQSLLTQKIREGGAVIVEEGPDIARGDSVTNRQVVNVDLGFA